MVPRWSFNIVFHEPLPPNRNPHKWDSINYDELTVLYLYTFKKSKNKTGSPVIVNTLFIDCKFRCHCKLSQTISNLQHCLSSFWSFPNGIWSHTSITFMQHHIQCSLTYTTWQSRINEHIYLSLLKEWFLLSALSS